MSILLSRRRLFGTALAATGLGAASLFAASDALALCGVPAEEGLWRNVNGNTRSIRRIRLHFVCQDVIANGRPVPAGAPWYVTIWGACHPSDCAWGEAPARREGRAIVANYDHRFATRVVRVRQLPGRRLEVRMHTDFRDGRRDYDTVDIFTRVA
jgi:hypothetical protein